MEKNFVYDINEIKSILPHRYPFLLIDRVMEIHTNSTGKNRVGNYAVAIKNVSANESFFNGHFPDMPVMPGVLLIEAIAQTGAMGCITKEDSETKNVEILIAKVNSARFRKAVVPGDQVVMKTEIMKEKGKMFLLSGTAKVSGELVAELELLAYVSFVDKEQG